MANVSLATPTRRIEGLGVTGTRVIVFLAMGLVVWPARTPVPGALLAPQGRRAMTLA